MAPFPEGISKEIRRRDNWTCTSCGKSSFEDEKWLLEAAHKDHTRNEKYLDTDNGKTQCRICHLMETIDSGDIRGASRIANRIWNTGLCHYSVYEKNPQLMRDHRVQLSELLSAMGLNGRINITERVSNIEQLKEYVSKRR